jgi:hypothetical protein
MLGNRYPDETTGDKTSVEQKVQSGKTSMVQKVYRDKTSGGTKHPWDKMSMGENVLGVKMSGRKKRPETRRPLVVFLCPSNVFLIFILIKNLLSMEGKSTKPMILLLPPHVGKNS